MNKTKITVSAPGKLMILGEHAVVYNRPCLVTAVDSRIKVTITKREDGLLEIIAPQISKKPYKRSINQLNNRDSNNIPKEVKFVCKTVENFISTNKIKTGLSIITESDFSHRYGFGSSSAVTVATLKGLSELFGIKYTKKEIFNIACELALNIQGVGSGFDIAAAVYGGTLYFITGGRKIERISDESLPLVAGYTGVKADTPTLVRQTAVLKKQNPRKFKMIFNTITELVERGKHHINRRNWTALGDLMRINQKLLIELGVSTKKLNDMCAAALGAGAYGAKLSGAGGGDCMIALVSDNKRKAVEKAIEAVEGKIIPVSTSAEGIRMER